MDDIKILSDLFRRHYGTAPALTERMAGAGGDRKYYRMTGDAGSCLGTVGDNPGDCRAFVALTGVLARNGVNVPEIYGVSDDGLHYIQQDLGDVSLLSLVGTPRWRDMMERTIGQLVRMQTVPEHEWINHVNYEAFSRRQVMWDLNYFKYEYLKPLKVPFDENLLEDDFEVFADMLSGAGAGPCGFMMRDCQGRNVMIHDNRPWFIDYQGGRRGPVVYDIVSLLWQAKARIDAAVRQELVELYAAEYHERTGADAEGILASVPSMALFRTLQVLGAYGFRGLVEKRAHFIESIGPALDNLSDMLSFDILDNCPELRAVCEYVTDHSPVPVSHSGLEIKVFSFSYKRGYPEDFTGNGGGFMFDCRGMHNPGRYEEYKPLTGLDKPVRDFLEERGEVGPFVSKAVDLVSPSVECYLRRGFSDLQVGFGCTGGRHRSVYCADGFARRIAELFPGARVTLVHREQGITETFNR